MSSKVGRYLSFANVMSSIAVFIALGGSAAAAVIVSSNADIGPNTVSGAHPPAGDGPNIIAGSVGTSDLGNLQVTSAKLHGGAVTSAKVTDGSLTGVDIAANGITSTQIDESSLGVVPAASDASTLDGVPASGFQSSIFGACASGSAVGSVGGDGSVTCNLNHLRPGIGNLNLGGISLAAQHCAIVEIPLSGVAIGDSSIMVPDAAHWPAGLIYQPLRADQTNKVPLDVCNPTSATVASPVVTLSIWVVKLTP
jgi:hypothetical protein